MGDTELPVDVRSVAVARGILRETLLRYDAENDRLTPAVTAGCAALMLSELVTNAVRHSRELLVLTITVGGPLLRVAVADDAPGLPVLKTAVRHDATSGRGLKIVDDLADRWGCTPGTGRKTVWFELTLP